MTPTTADAAIEPATAAQWPRWLFRVTSTISAIMLFDQAIFAGQFLSGSYPSLHTHRENATFAGISVLVSLVAAFILRRFGDGPRWPMLACVGIFGLIGLQIVLGFARLISLHVPLGVVIIMLATALAVRAWRVL